MRADWPTEIKMRLAMATPGPWYNHHGYIYTTGKDASVGIHYNDADGEFVAHAPTDLMGCLAEIERLRARLVVDDAMVEHAITTLLGRDSSVLWLREKWRPKTRAALEAALGGEHIKPGGDEEEDGQTE